MDSNVLELNAQTPTLNKIWRKLPDPHCKPHFPNFSCSLACSAGLTAMKPPNSLIVIACHPAYRTLLVWRRSTYNNRQCLTSASVYAEIVDHKTPFIYYLARMPNQFSFRLLMLADAGLNDLLHRWLRTSSSKAVWLSPSVCPSNQLVIVRRKHP